MTNIALWNIQAGSNTSAPPAGAPENMLRSAVNDTMREMMAATRRWYGDTQSTQQTTGGPPSNAYLLDSVGRINGAGYALYTDLPLLTFRVHAANTGPVTLNVDGLGTKNFFKAPGSAPFAAGELTAGQVCVVAYNATLGAFELIGPKVPRDGFAVNVSMIFKMATPPLGWVKSTTDNDSSIRIIGGAAGVPLTVGGSVGISAAFGLTGVTGLHVLLKTELPIYNLDLTTMGATTAGVTAPGALWSNSPSITVATAKNYQTQTGSGDISNVTFDSDRQNVNSRITGTLALGGGGIGHNHPMPDIKYVDVVVAVRT